MAGPTIYSRRELVQQAQRRILTYTDRLTWFGTNSVGKAIAETVGGAANQGYRLYKALQRRFTLLGSAGDALTEVAGERGAKRRGPSRSRLLVVVVPWSSTVTAITPGLGTAIEVLDSSRFTAGDSVRIRNVDGSVTEKTTILSISSGSGPNGGDELNVGSLIFSYTPADDDVQVLLRHAIPTETVITTQAGVGFQTTAPITIGDFNPLLAGESPPLALADKVWCEATITGASGDVDPRTVSGLQVPDTQVRNLYNPERGFGGDDTETDPELRYRAAHRPSALAQETLSWIEALAVEADQNVLRATTRPSDAISTLSIAVLSTNGGPLGVKALAALETYVGARVRSYMVVDASNVDLVAIEVEAQVKLAPNVTLRQAWVDASARVANYTDFRRWDWEKTVDWLEILRQVGLARGVQAVVQSTFLPAADIPIGPTQLPVLVRVSLQDVDTLKKINAQLAVSFASSEA